jgi:hypothetical protein
MRERVVRIVDVHALFVVVECAARPRSTVLRPEIGLRETEFGRWDHEQFGDRCEQMRMQRDRVERAGL